MEHFLLALAIACSIAGLAAVAYLLVRQRRLTAHLRRRNAALADGLRRRDEELRHLATERLPALLQSLHNPAVTVPGPLHDPHSLGPAYERGSAELMELFAGSAEGVRARADKAAKLTLRSTMRGVQSLANEQQLAISTMQERHDDPDVLEDLLRLDHMNAQLGRRAQATAVLCGSWPGQQRSASSLSDVVRGATSRIRDYLRVRVHAPVNAAVVSRAVEPVVLVLAELLDNAARHSRPDTTVEVNVQNTHNGVAIVIDDAGVAMDAEELERAGRLLAGSGTADINRLGDPPQIGFAVAGLLADRYGFTVSVDTRSPYGGVRAVVFLPSALITAVPAGDGAPRAAEPRPKAAAAARAAFSGPEAPAPRPAPARTPGGLPKRRRTALPATSPSAASGGADDRARPARETAAGLGAWQRGTRSGRAASPPGGADPAAPAAAGAPPAPPHARPDGHGEDQPR
ncbi:sensor histidine kinase [Actinomadura sp. 21ATH]|uniref:ATP-binding protein n=1 Tax=Actinomadura sp. 21ATH TaxID=1735444 RepID=UPI0035BF0853